MKRLAVLAILGLVAVASCGDGDDGGDDEASAGPSIEALCAEVAAYVDGNDFSDEATEAAYADFESVAPDQIRGDIETLHEALDGPVAGDERTVAAGDRFTAYVEQACGIDFAADDGP
jgi:hypothetical protein